MTPRETVERELKLSVGEAFALPELGGEPLESRVFDSTYHDTADHRLARSGITLRHRVEQGKGLWQLKLPRGDARAELELESGPGVVPEQLARLLVALVRGADLVPVARLRTRREGVRAGGAEIVHDSVSVLDDGRVEQTFEELEIELLDGDERALRRIEKALRRAGAGDGEARPKLFRVLGLEGRLDAHEPADGSPGHALAAAFRTQYERLLAHDPGTRLGSDAEDLHQLRVATRRFRAFLRAGRTLVDRRWADELREELGWLGSALGPVRDLDVMLEHLRGEAAALDGEDATRFRDVLNSIEEQRVKARVALLEALESDRYTALLARLEAAGDPPLADDGEVELEDIWRAEHVRLRKAIEKLGEEPEDDDLHAARIKAKRARYAAELAALDGYVKAAKRLQDVLGEHQDAVIAEGRLRVLAAESPGAALAVGRLVERGRRRRARARADWPDAWRRLAKQATKV